MNILIVVERKNKIKLNKFMLSTLFNIYLDYAISRWRQIFDSGIQLSPKITINILAYADDIALIQETEDKLQKAVFVLKNVCEDLNLTISTEKTKVMAFLGNYPRRSKIERNQWENFRTGIELQLLGM